MAKQKPQKSLEASLWDSCNKLRGSVEPSEYKHVMLSLIFLKYANDRFDEQRKKLMSEGKQAFLEMLPFYTKDNVFFIPEHARWSYLMENAKQADIAIKIDTALNEIESKNPSLAGALPDNYFSRVGLESNVLASLLDKLNNINLQTEDDKDIFGRIYEYFLLHFAMQEGKGKGEYYTPKTVVALLCELIEPYRGIVYDGACGSGGMFVQSVKFIDEHKGNKKEVSVYGQESIQTTLKLAKMNLAIRGIAANFGSKAASTFQNDQHPDLKVDYALMNPPFNQKGWREESELNDDPRWRGYKTPPVSNANYGWILNMISKLSQNGVGCLLLANGALSSEGDEYEIRKQLIHNDLVEAIIILPNKMFYSTDISVTVWIFNKNKKAHAEHRNGREINFRDRSGEILFIDLRRKGHPFEKKYIEFTEGDRREICEIYHSWQGISDAAYSDIEGLCCSIKSSDLEDYSLIPSKYIAFDKEEDTTNLDEEILSVDRELRLLFENERTLAKAVLDSIGEIKNG